MSLYADKLSEYKKWHKPIWKRLEDALKIHGEHNYSIFFDEETHILFGYAEIESEEKWESIAETYMYKEWWKYMADMMPANPGNSPVSTNLEEVFYMN